MAANKFATMLHKKGNKMICILVYTLLEWTLIGLLLINAFFSFLIAKFAAYFGLKPPCIFCSRVDHVFEPAGKLSYRRLLCDDHAAEISGLGFCSTHRKLAEASEMCEDCAAARGSPSGADRAVALLSWMKRSEDGEKDLRCSCCDVSLESGFYSPYLFLKPSWPAAVECTEKEDLIEHLVDDGDCEEMDREMDEEEKKDEEISSFVRIKDSSLEMLTVGMDDGFVEDERVVPVELIDSTTFDKTDADYWPSEYQFVVCHSAVDVVPSVLDAETAAVPELVEVIKECSSVPPAEVVDEGCLSQHQNDVPRITEVVGVGNEPFDLAKEFGEMQDIEVGSIAASEDLGEAQAFEEDDKTMDVEATCEISIGSEICDQEQIDQVHIDGQAHLSVEIENQSSEVLIEVADKRQGAVIEVEQVEASELVEANARDVDRLSICPELNNEVDEERAPETPTYIEGIHALHKRFLFERRESGTESIDGSVASEIEGSEPLTIEQLKSALKSERKALSALYTELEEERSASAIAANQTMAMITRLQEEKAAMQMEALQYQRMMEEQSEYDQEALQLLNELMMKREKEKLELEKELEVYRKKVLLLEARERRNNSNTRSGTSSASLSAEESDDVSLGSNEGDECSYRLHESNQNTPLNAVLSSETDQDTTKHLITLDESLAEFEEERMSILEQLKALEEKLFTLDDEAVFNNGEAIKHLSEENGHGLNGHHPSPCDDQNGHVNGFLNDLDTDDKLHCKCRSIGVKGKRLLPLFDAIDMENEDETCSKEGVTDALPESLSKFSVDRKKLAIAEEVDNVYERLQALEADREFLKHCIRSLKKGDKGMDLLQEILQHLRDLRSVELRVRNAGDTLASLSA
ncbi:myosin-binding protein 2-like [Dioscorea cayenensis subsp. rotundata]|uniref:Myosin-binding protein 2-like n=1 Tax=Dioscorea cayennensis subsp. rotundata TaxID=55577 RepID=A0AB40BC43_DIOCR|nr:myosin-binding protein 2-like [Dioscorea cayenensis subsp. rotundata]